MTRYLKSIIGFAVAVLFAAPMLADAQELPSIFPGVTTLGERTVPSPFGVSPQMTEIIGERQIPPDIPVPGTRQEWLDFQALFDKPGEELGRQGVKLAEARYEIREIAGVRTYVVTPKKINSRFC